MNTNNFKKIGGYILIVILVLLDVIGGGYFTIEKKAVKKRPGRKTT